MSAGVNGVRGEVVRRLGGVERRLCLTLGALAELETAFGAEGLEALSERLGRLTARDLTTVLAALLRGGGETGAAADLGAATADVREATEAVAATFRAALG